MPFSPPTQAWFDATFSSPTDAQRQAWPAIERGEHTLVLAPTGSGKTLAAFLWALDRLLTVSGTGCRVVYVSPLKALSYDVERNLRAPLAGIALEAQRQGFPVPEVRVATRTGDTPATDRRLMAKHPPDILITTPESLYLLLTSRAASLLTGVEHVIVDEVHAVAATKRGAHLALTLERLEANSERPPQRIGLSATQRPLEELGRWLGGQRDGRPRPVTIVDAGTRKPLDLSVVVPVEDMGEPSRRMYAADEDSDGDGMDLIMRGSAAGSPEVRSSIWPAIYPELLTLIRQHRSTLVFVNSRRLAERLAARLNELATDQPEFTLGGSAYLGAGAPGELVRAHHGSIARQQRLEIEDALKAGRLPALVATSSLELGIDMGAIDLVIQVEAPTSVASGLQRIGRAGHQVGEPSKGRIFPKFRHDLLVAAVLTQRMHAGLVERTEAPRQPLDVLAQQLVAVVAGAERPVATDELAELVGRAYSFDGLSREMFEAVLDMLAGRYPSDEFAELRPRLVWDRVAGQLTARPGAKLLAVTNAGTIPDRGLFGVFTPEGSRVGELDEEMVYESRVGETFLLGATTWRITDITHDRVVVVPAPGVPGKMPFWRGDTPGRPYELGQAIGAFTREVTSPRSPWTDERLAEECDLDALAVRNLRAYLEEEREATGGLFPTDRQVVVERFPDEMGDWRLVVLSPFGARVHAPWAMAIEAKLAAQGTEVQAVWSDDGIILRLPEASEPPPSDLVVIDPDDVEELVVQALGSSGLFAGRFRENAARALLLPRRRPGSRTPLWQLRQRAADLLAVASKYESFPILLETYRDCLRDSFDLPALRGLLADLAARRVGVRTVEVTAPSPFASGLAFAFVAQFFYESDAPLAERRAQALTLDRRMLAELVGSDELADLLDPAVIDALEAELQALQEGRWATSAEAIVDLARRIGDLTVEELAARCAPGLVDQALPELLARRRLVQVPVAGEVRLIVDVDAGRYRDGLGVLPPPGLPDAYLEPVADALVQLVRRWARTHGPFVAAEPAHRFGLAESQVLAILEQLAAGGQLERGSFRRSQSEGPRVWRSESQWCDAGVLRVLRQRSLAALRREIEPTDADSLARLLPAWQGVATAGAEPVEGGLDRLYEVIGQLQGVALPASVWETDVLPARVRDYGPGLLDELLASGEVMWVGAGSIGTQDGRIVLLQREVAPLLLPAFGFGPTGASPSVGLDGLHDHIRRVLSRRGACFFRELAAPGWSDTDLVDALWDLVWAGEVTSDAFGAVRAGLAGRRPTRTARRTAGRARHVRPRPGALGVSGPPRAQGRWSLTARELGLADGVEVAPADGVLAERAAEAKLALVGSLLERYGVLTRDAVRGEGVPGGFAGVYPVLRALEESGRIRRGYFVSGQGAAQFALPGAVDRLRALRDAPEPSARQAQHSVLLLAATDPANAYGISLPWPATKAGVATAAPSAESEQIRPVAPAGNSGNTNTRLGKGPQRVAGAYVILVGGQLSLYVERGGRRLQAFRPFDGTWEEDAVAGLGKLVSSGRWTRLSVADYPDELEPYLRAGSFVPTPKGLVLYA